MREKYESLALADLRAIAKTRGIKGTTGLKKAELIELMLAEDEKDKAAGKDVAPKPVLRNPGEAKEEKQEEKKEEESAPAAVSETEEEPAKEPEISEEVKLLTEIRDLLKEEKA